MESKCHEELLNPRSLRCSHKREGCHGEPVEPWWAGLYARAFDKLRVTPQFKINYLANATERVSLITVTFIWPG